jgi:hypothetical protein
MFFRHTILDPSVAAREAVVRKFGKGGTWSGCAEQVLASKSL